MIRQVLIIAELTWREARRRKIVWVALILGTIFIALYSVGLYFVVRELTSYQVQGQRDYRLDTGFNFFIMAGMYVISFLGVMLAVLASVGTVSGEMSSHTIQTIVTKPLRRGTVILGKWLGLLTMLAAYIAFLGGGIAAGTRIIAHYTPPQLIAGIGLMILQSIVMISVSILGGTRLSTVANGVTCFMLYGLAFIGSWLERIGAATQNDTLVDMGILSSLLVPSESMWGMAAYRMQPPIINSLGVSPFSVASPPSAAMFIYSLAYIGLCVALAVHSFARRDL